MRDGAQAAMECPRRLLDPLVAQPRAPAATLTSRRRSADVAADTSDVCETQRRSARRRYDLPMLAAAWVQAIAAAVTAAAVLYAVIVWAWNRRPRGVVEWIMGRYFPPRVSLEAGVRTARKFARSGHPPYTPTQGAVSPEQPRDYLLAKVTETVWAAASGSDPNLIPVRNYLAALAERAGTNPARDFALGVLTERVRQEENGWPDQKGDPGGNRGPHSSGDSHQCLLDRKHQVEDAIYAIGEPA